MQKVEDKLSTSPVGFDPRFFQIGRYFILAAQGCHSVSSACGKFLQLPAHVKFKNVAMIQSSIFSYLKTCGSKPLLIKAVCLQPSGRMQDCGGATIITTTNTMLCHRSPCM